VGGEVHGRKAVQDPKLLVTTGSRKFPLQKSLHF